MIFYSSESKQMIEVLSFRDQYKNGIRNTDNSIILTIELNNVNRPMTPQDAHIDTTIIGWERNEKNLLQPRVVDMSGSMNTEKLAESAVSLNLKLMKWRIMPNIDLDVIKKQKAHLKCRYITNDNPFLLIAPVKQEEIFDSPQIFLYYDVISEKQIELIKSLALPRVRFIGYLCKFCCF